MNDHEFVARAGREARGLVPYYPPPGPDPPDPFGYDHRKVSDDYAVQVRYAVLRFQGQSHNMAEVLATRSFPGTRTDREFNQGRCNGNQFEAAPGRGDYLRAIAEAAGVSTTGKYYAGGLADYPGDPTAWVSDRGDVLRVAREKGYRVTGQVDYDPGTRFHANPVPDVEIDPAIVEAHTVAYLAEHGGRPDDAREHVRGVLTGKEGGGELLVKDPVTDAF